MLYLRILNINTSSYLFHRTLNIPRFRNMPGFSKYIRVLNMSGFTKRTLHHTDAWQGSDYSSGFGYTRVLNIPGLGKVLKKFCIIDDWQNSKHSSGSKHATVLNTVCQGYAIFTSSFYFYSLYFLGHLKHFHRSLENYHRKFNFCRGK